MTNLILVINIRKKQPNHTRNKEEIGNILKVSDLM